MGHHDAIHRHYSDGPRRQQRTRPAAKDSTDTGCFSDLKLERDMVTVTAVITAVITAVMRQFLTNMR